jgi:ATP-binding cassette subfamily F protein 3
VVSHDRNFLNAVVTDIIHLHSQRLESYRGDYENFVKTKEDRLKNQQREYEAQFQYREHIQVRSPHTGLNIPSCVHTDKLKALWQV